MSKTIPTTQEEFDELLNWFSSNREEAGEVYEKIRQGLIRFFDFRGAANSEDLTDETINRVAKKLKTLDFSPGHKPITFFYGFASNVFLEEIRRNQKHIGLEEIPFAKTIQPSEENNDVKFDCLNNCLKKLSDNERSLLIGYYRQEKTEKLEHRRKLAENLNMTMNNLHVKIHRLRTSLRPCLKKCLNK